MQQHIRASEDGWAQFYVFVKLLAEMELWYGDAHTERVVSVPLRGVVRTDRVHGKLLYDCMSDPVYILVLTEGALVAKVDRTILEELSVQLLSEIKHGSGHSFACPSGSELMEMLLCTSVTAGREGDDIHLVLPDEASGLVQGFVIRSLIGSDPLLLGGSPDTNFIYCGERPHTTTWSARVGVVRMIRELFGTMRDLYGRFSYAGMQSVQFNHNLSRINPELPAVIARIVMHYYQEDTKSIERIMRRISREGDMQEQFGMNDDECEDAVKEFLVALIYGMKADREWSGADAIGRGLLILRQDGKIFGYDSYNGRELEQWLYRHTVLETADKTEAAFGVPFEQSGGKQCVMLNLQIRLRQ